MSGGGSLGHIVPSLAIADALEHIRPDIPLIFVCAPRREEMEFLRTHKKKYVVMHAGKFPRGLSIRWLTFPVLSLVALAESLLLILRIKPSLVFSKGGYISVPLCIVAWCLRVPIVLHESDAVAGMGNRLLGRMATVICVGSRSALGRNPRTVFTGNPVRVMIGHGSRDAGRRITGFSGRKPVLLFIGGSQGAKVINDAVESQLSSLLALGDIVHITGRGKRGDIHHAHYYARELVTDELPHLYALADIVVSRAGAGTLSELALLSKPVIVIPLRGLAQDHQQKNAHMLLKEGAVVLLAQEHIDRLAGDIAALLHNDAKRRLLGERLHAAFPAHADATIAKVLLDARKKTV